MAPFFKLLFAVALLLGGAAITSGPNAADLIGQAKADGIIGETASGYLAVYRADAATPALVRQMEDINLKRKAEYREIANRTAGATLSDVEKLAGAKLVERAPSGQVVRDSTGQWVVRP